jgi:hypothetical protein
MEQHLTFGGYREVHSNVTRGGLRQRKYPHQNGLIIAVRVVVRWRREYFLQHHFLDGWRYHLDVVLEYPRLGLHAHAPRDTNDFIVGLKHPILFHLVDFYLCDAPCEVWTVLKYVVLIRMICFVPMLRTAGTSGCRTSDLEGG